MTTDEIQNIIDYAYPKIKKYYGKGKRDYPPVKLHHDIYARLSGDDKQRGEHSKTTKAQYDENTNIIWIYYPNIKNEEDALRSLIHEYTHYRQDHKLFKKYKQIYSYEDDPTEIEAHKNEEDWHLFSQK
jgi:hypothetical protein